MLNTKNMPFLSMISQSIAAVSLIFFYFSCPQVSYAGIPEPGMIIYGKVFDDSGVLVTSGELVWSFTPMAGGDIITIEAQLEEIDVEGGPFSYRVQVPFESAVSGSPVSGNCIPLSSAGADYSWTARVTGTNIEKSDLITISLDDRGSFMDVRIGDPGFVDEDGDGIDDAWEQAIVDADPNDSINTVYDVLHGDDFDNDGELNGTEYNNLTDPTDAMSTFDSDNAYTSFHFEIFRGADQTGPGIFNEFFWGAQLICLPRTGETFDSGILSKPLGSNGSNPVVILAEADGNEAQSIEENYISFSHLITDYLAGEYRVDLIADNGGAEPYHLRFKITVPEYDSTDFPAYITIEDPLPDQTEVLLEPLFEFDADTWDYIQILKDTMDEVYFYVQDGNGSPLDTHQLPGLILDYKTAYFLRLNTNDWGNTWLGTMTELMFTTIGQDCPCDIDTDGDVDGFDLSVFSASYGFSAGDPEFNLDADFDMDGSVDLDDMMEFRLDFGKTGCETP